jgi:hypothetical protein
VRFYDLCLPSPSLVAGSVLDDGSLLLDEGDITTVRLPGAGVGAVVEVVVGGRGPSRDVLARHLTGVRIRDLHQVLVSGQRWSG